MIGACKDACDLASWPMRDRIRALKRIIPRRKVEGVLRDCGLADRGCRRLPGWFLVWFVVALGLFCRDSKRSARVPVAEVLRCHSGTRPVCRNCGIEYSASGTPDSHHDFWWSTFS